MPVTAPGVVDEGHGPAVVLLHGFPDTPHTFDQLAAALVADGFRVVRPWLRGYHPAAPPAGSRTSVSQLVADLEALLSRLGLVGSGLPRPALVGHDWGAVTAWAATSGRPHPFRAVVALAIPPAPVHARLALDPVQALRRSGYMWWMQVPGVARVMPAIAERLTRRWSPGWVVPADHLARVRALAADPDVARAMAGYYRWVVPAVLTGRHPADRSAVPDVPVRYLHGARDTCFPVRAADLAQRHLPEGSVGVVDGAGHFLHLERSAVVTDDVRAFLLRHR